MKYQAQSPDEAALVTAARCFGYVFTNRSAESITVSRLNEEITYELLHIADFDNNRKRMSVVVREPDTGQIYCYTKGADTTVMEVLAHVDEDVIRATQISLDDFASDGLRTLVLAYKTMTENEWSDWSAEYHKASTSMENRDEMIADCHENLEQNLLLAGVTAVEDKLQDGVPDTIKHILEGQIKLWVLTGDKLETAMNIGYSCNLLTADMTDVFPIDEQAPEEVEKELKTAQQEIQKNPNGKFGLVITGASLEHALTTYKVYLNLQYKMQNSYKQRFLAIVFGCIETLSISYMLSSDAASKSTGCPDSEKGRKMCDPCYW